MTTDAAKQVVYEAAVALVDDWAAGQTTTGHRLIAAVAAANATCWVHWDTAAFVLAQRLGLFRDTAFEDVKYVFWGNNPLGQALHQLLLALAVTGVIEHDATKDRFRGLTPWLSLPDTPASEISQE